MTRRLLMLAVLAVCCVPGLDAADVVGPPPGAWIFQALGGVDLAQKVGERSEARRVKLRYEGLALTSHLLTYEMLRWPGTEQTVIRSLELTSDTAAEDQVVLDSQEALSPLIGFRGVLHPRAVVVQVLDQDPAAPTRVRYRADLAKVGEFRGLLLDARTKTWVPHQGWADKAELWCEARLDPGEGSPKDLRISAVVLHAEPAAEGGIPGRRVALDRWKGPEAAPTDAWPATGIAGHLDARKVTIAMGADGAARITGDDLSTWGTVLPGNPP